MMTKYGILSYLQKILQNKRAKYHKYVLPLNYVALGTLPTPLIFL